jgi:hypothetical protein
MMAGTVFLIIGIERTLNASTMLPEILDEHTLRGPMTNEM